MNPSQNLKSGSQYYSNKNYGQDSQNTKKQNQKYRFNESESQLLKKRFDKISEKGQINKNKFRDSMGILGLDQAPFFSDRIFESMDINGSGKISFDEYLQYTHTLLFGQDQEKVQISFKILDIGNKDVIKKDDIVQTLKELCLLWNNITGSKVKPTNDYINKLFNSLDSDKDNVITKEEYLRIYSSGVEIFGWFEFLNQDQFALPPTPTAKKYQEKLKFIQNELEDIVGVLREDSQDLSNYEGKSILFPNSSSQVISPPSEVKTRRKSTLQNNLEDTSMYSKGSDINAVITRLDMLKNLSLNTESINKQQPQNPVLQQKQINNTNNIDNDTVTQANIKRDQYKKRGTVAQNVMQAQNQTAGKNITVYFGHENWNLMLNMMIGIRTAIMSLYSVENKDFTQSDFKLRCQYELIQKRVDTFDKSKAYKFYDYAPNVFEKIRLLYGISNKDFLRSVGPEQLLGNLILGKLSSLTELTSTGKSGSFFYYSEDGKFMLKTMSQNEFYLLKRVLEQYYHHLKTNFNTLMTKIFGLYKLKIFVQKDKPQKIYFHIMGNLFNTLQQIKVRFDLKGSTYGRQTIKNNEPIPSSVALKDLDFDKMNQPIIMESKVRDMIIDQMIIDLDFFYRNSIIDYSMLVGVIDVPDNMVQEALNYQNQYPDNDLINEDDLKNNKKITATRIYEQFQGGILSKDKKQIYLIGIIDFLTEFGTKKKLEYSFKRTLFGKGVSCVPPDEYAERFQDYMETKVFL